MALRIAEESLKKHKTLPCLFCKEIKDASKEYYPSGSRLAMLRADSRGITRSVICNSCSDLIFDFLRSSYRGVRKGLYQFCAAFDFCYHEALVKEMAGVSRERYLSEYMRLLNSDVKYDMKTFTDSVGIDLTVEPEEDAKLPTSMLDEASILTEDDLNNRREILTIFKIDPFILEPIPVRKRMYSDLVTMTGPEMVDDLVRQKAAIEIVRAFARIDQFNEYISEASRDSLSAARNAKEIKTLIDTKNKETDMIMKFSRDHGFAERYALAKSRGSGTLGAVQREVEEYGYDSGKVNFFDIKTSKSMKQAADISSRAVMSQLALSEADYVDMLKQQRKYIVDLTDRFDRAQEELRLTYKQITKEELLKELAIELKRKGLHEGEVYKAILSEIDYDDKTIIELKEQLAQEKAEQEKKEES